MKHAPLQLIIRLFLCLLLNLCSHILVVYTAVTRKSPTALKQTFNFLPDMFIFGLNIYVTWTCFNNYRNRSYSQVKPQFSHLTFLSEERTKNILSFFNITFLYATIFGRILHKIKDVIISFGEEDVISLERVGETDISLNLFILIVNLLTLAIVLYGCHEFQDNDAWFFSNKSNFSKNDSMFFTTHFENKVYNKFSYLYHFVDNKNFDVSLNESTKFHSRTISSIGNSALKIQEILPLFESTGNQTHATIMIESTGNQTILPHLHLYPPCPPSYPYSVTVTYR